MQALDALYLRLVLGGFCVIDDYRAKHGVSAEIVDIDWTGVRWRRYDDHWTLFWTLFAVAALAVIGAGIRPACRPRRETISADEVGIADVQENVIRPRTLSGQNSSISSR